MSYEEDVQSMSFEESMRELESLVQKLEAGGTDLDESIGIYERAVALRNRCKEILDQSERRIKKIMESSGEIKEEDFEID